MIKNLILNRKVFVNKNNKQGSLTLPSKVLKKIELETGKPVDMLKIQILSPQEVKDMKNR